MHSRVAAGHCYDSGQQRNVFDDDLVQLLFGAQPHHLCLRWVESLSTSFHPVVDVGDGD